MDPDHPGPQERLRVEDAPIDVGFGCEVDDRVDGARRGTACDRGHERPDDDGIRDVALDEAQPGGLLRIGLDGREVGPVAGIGQLVEDRDPRSIAPAEDVANEG